MAEYIDREVLKNDIATSTEPFNTGSVFRAINRQIAADVAPVRHGRWELEYETYGKMRCSVCKKEALIKKAIDDVGVTTNYVDSNYCPNCGAKMDERRIHND